MPIPIPPSPIVMRQPDEEIGLVQGIMPDSINEWYVAQALDRLRMEYIFQYQIFGGTSLRGGQVIDFVVFTATGSLPVPVNGAYWHNFRNDPELMFTLAEAERYFKRKPVVLEEEETSTRDKAYEAVVSKVQE